MFVTYIKVLSSHLWPAFTLAFVFNLLLFKFFSWHGLSAATDSFYMPVLTLFSLQNFLLGFWLTWQNNKQAFWQQIFISIPRTIKHHLGFLVLVSATVQLLPLLGFMQLSINDFYQLTTLDYLGALYLWLLSCLAFGMAILNSVWRHWTLALLVLPFPLYYDLFFSQVWIQIAYFLVVAASLYIALLWRKPARQLLVSVFLSFGVYMALLVLVQILSNANQASPQQTQIQLSKDLGDTYPGRLIQHHDLNGCCFLHHRSLLYKSDNARPDWSNYRYNFFNPGQTMGLRDWQAIKKLLQKVWQEQHPGQVPMHLNLNDDAMLFLFSDAIYKASNHEITPVWQASGAESILSYNQSTSKTPGADYEYLYFSTGKTGYLLEPSSLRVQEMRLTAPMLMGSLTSFKQQDGSLAFQLMLIAQDDRQYVYRFTNLEEPLQPFLVKDLQFSVAEQFSYFSISAASPFHDLITQAMWGGNIDQLLLWSNWLLLGNLLAVVICWLLFRGVSRNYMFAMLILTLVFSWPMLLTLVLVLGLPSQHKCIMAPAS